MSEMFGAVFSRGEAAEAVSDGAWLRAMLKAEVALAEAAAEVKAVSPEAAAAVAEAAHPDNFDLGTVADSGARIGNPVGGVVDRLRALVPQEHHEAIHFNATSQDILDTAMMLVAREAVGAIRSDLKACADALDPFRKELNWHQMTGRTLLQPAKRVGFGNLVGSWRTGLGLARERLANLHYYVSFRGPVGAFDIDWPARAGFAHRRFAERLGLREDLSWHTVRNPVVRIGAAAAEAAGACGKVAVDIILLSQGEIGEVGEGRPGGSTSMPHKRNPVAATAARACAARTPGLVATLYAAMPQELQRSPGLWHSEWETLSDLLRLTGSAAAWLRESLEGLQVHPEAMKRNLEGGRG